MSLINLFSVPFKDAIYVSDILRRNFPNPHLRLQYLNFNLVFSIRKSLQIILTLHLIELESNIFILAYIYQFHIIILKACRSYLHTALNQILQHMNVFFFFQPDIIIGVDSTNVYFPVISRFQMEAKMLEKCTVRTINTKAADVT